MDLIYRSASPASVNLHITCGGHGSPKPARLFGRLDFDLWERLGHNPIRMLREVGRPRLNQAAKNKEYLAAYDKVFAQFDAYMDETDTWTSAGSS